jgi:hypothetical protein
MIVASAGRLASRGQTQSVVRAWPILRWIGVAFIVVGGADFALVWFPLDLGSQEWLFATVTQSFNGLPILVLGLGLVIAASEQGEARGWGLVGVAVAVAMLVWVLVGIALWGMTVPTALRTVPLQVAAGLQKAVVKTSIQSLVYSAILVYLVRRAWGAARAGDA